jgi:hypothetical protein
MSASRILGISPVAVALCIPSRAAHAKAALLGPSSRDFCLRLPGYFGFVLKSHSSTLQLSSLLFLKSRWMDLKSERARLRPAATIEISSITLADLRSALLCCVLLLMLRYLDAPANLRSQIC